MICVDNYRFTVGFLGALLIIGGVLMSEHQVDKNVGAGGYTAALAFLTGWGVIIYTASLNYKNEFDSKRFVRIGLPAMAVFSAAIAAQSQLKNNRGAVLVLAMVFMAAWGLFAWQISTDGGFMLYDYDKRKGYLALGGAIGVALSMLVLFGNREFNLLSGLHNGPGNVYNPGLVLFSLSWLLIVTSLSLKEPNVCM